MVSCNIYSLVLILQQGPIKQRETSLLMVSVCDTLHLEVLEIHIFSRLSVTCHVHGILLHLNFPDFDLLQLMTLDQTPGQRKCLLWVQIEFGI